MKIIEVTWRFFPVFWFGGILAITLYPFIIYRYRPGSHEMVVQNDGLHIRRHEWIHIDQVRKHGWWKFYILYIVNPKFRRFMEIQAYTMQTKARSTFK
jgi:hypothetical protein